jgi:dihydropteroate synthase
MKPAVMRAACDAGASLINDVNALRAPGAIEVALSTEAAVCLMHMQGEPRDMQHNPHYGNVTTEVAAFLDERLQTCLNAGLPADRIALDPGFGFGKTLAHNLQLLARLDKIASLGQPVLVGVSRKSMFGTLLDVPASERIYASVTAAGLAVWQAAHIIRSHDVRATLHAVKVAAATQQYR